MLADVNRRDLCSLSLSLYSLSLSLCLLLLAPGAAYAEWLRTPTDRTFYVGEPVNLRLPPLKVRSSCKAAFSTYTLVPSLPAGLSFDGGSGTKDKRTISGVPSATAERTVLYQGREGGGFQCDHNTATSFKITVLSGGAMSLNPSDVTSTGATLTLANNSSAWWFKGTGTNGYTKSCTSQAANASATLTGLSGNSTYTFTAYRTSGCSGDGMVDVTFTTPGSVSLWTHDIEQTKVDLEVSGLTDGQQYSMDLVSPTDTGSQRVTSGPLRCRTYTAGRGGMLRGERIGGLLAGTEYTARAYRGAGCLVLNRLGSVTFDTRQTSELLLSLSASSVTNTTAVLAVANNWSEAWWYERNGDSSTCTKAPNASNSATVSGLQYNTTYSYNTYAEAGCSAHQGSIRWYDNVWFSTTGPLTITVSERSATGFKVTLAGHTDDDTFPSYWSFKAARKLGEYLGWESTPCVLSGKGRTTVWATGLTAGQTYTIYIYRGKSCSSILDAATMSTTTTSLTSQVGADGAATLSVNEYDGAWSYSGGKTSGQTASASSGQRMGPGEPARVSAEASADGQCRAMSAGTYTAELRGLTPDTAYSFTAYDDQSCAGNELGSATMVTPEADDMGPGDIGPGDIDPGGGDVDRGGNDGDDDGDAGDEDDGGVEPEPPGDPAPRWVGDLALEVPDDGAFILSWRGEWQDAGGTVAVEARSRRHGWQDLLTGVDAAAGEVRIEGLDADEAYTLRLRRESEADGTEEADEVRVIARSDEISGLPDGWKGRCRGGDRYMCLRGRRFELRAHWSNPDIPGDVGNAGAVATRYRAESGLFWFFDPANVELVVKVLDGRELNGAHWVFFGALSDVEYWLTVRDRESGVSRTYHNAPKQVCGQSDVRAFVEDAPVAASGSSRAGGPAEFGGIELASLQSAALVPPDAEAGVPESVLASVGAASRQSAGTCEPGPERLCLRNGRFAVEVRFVDPDATDEEGPVEKPGYAMPSLTTGQTGFFWFFNEDNVELAAKVLDGRGLNGRHWLLYGGLSDVEYTLTATDTVTGVSRTYRNEAGNVCGRIDTDAF